MPRLSRWRLATFQLAFMVGLTLVAGATHADVFGYVDAQGTAHFAAEKIDARYQLFFRGDGSFDSDNLGSPRTGGGKSSAIKPVAPAMSRYLSHHPNLKKFQPFLQQAASDYTVDIALLQAVMAAESGFNPAAVSPKGAIGLMQVMPATAERYGMQSDRRKSVAQKLTDPRTNIRLAARYLRDLHRLFPNQQQLVLASYNAGEGAVKKYRNTIPPYPETRNYVRLVSQFYEVYNARTPARLTAVQRVSSSGTAGAKRVHLVIPARNPRAADPASTFSTESLTEPR